MDKKGTFYYIAIIVGVLLVCAVCWYLLREPNVHDQRSRANDVRESFERIDSEQRNAENDIDRAGRRIDASVKSLDEITERISDAENAITASQERRGECAEIVTDSERRIEESRAILQGIRSRAGQNRK